MIRIYSYYNHGGFKDMYLGTFDEDVDVKYFIPLYKVYEKRLAENPNDKKSADKITLWSSLVKIKELNKNSSEAYPQDASIVISHSGYKIMLKQLQNGTTLLAVRDIPGHADEFNRPSPFAVMLIGDGKQEYKNLCILADYLKNKENLSLFETFCSGVFEHDIKVNALQFHFKEFVSEVKDIISKHEIKEEKFINDRKVKLIVIPETLKAIDAIREQGLTKYDIELLYDTSGKKYPTHDENPTRNHVAHSIATNKESCNNEKDIWAYARSLEVMIQGLEARISILEGNSNTNGKI
ncbi:MAG: hypothetical protein KBT06_04195 [Prevotellaceae bacterium]|nr:hypothetical protein [Candidatus Colivivens equi]